MKGQPAWTPGHPGHFDSILPWYPDLHPARESAPIQLGSSSHSELFTLCSDLEEALGMLIPVSAQWQGGHHSAKWAQQPRFLTQGQRHQGPHPPTVRHRQVVCRIVDECFSKRDPCASSVSITWELVRNQHKFGYYFFKYFFLSPLSSQSLLVFLPPNTYQFTSGCPTFR